MIFWHSGPPAAIISDLSRRVIDNMLIKFDFEARILYLRQLNDVRQGQRQRHRPSRAVERQHFRRFIK